MSILPRYTERIEYKLEIIPPNSTIQCREATIVEKDGVEIARSYHRSVYAPGEDVSEAPEEVRKVARVLWDRNIDPEFGVTPEGAE